MTNTLNTPAEAIEMQYPLRVRAFESTDNGGSGRYRGGGGIVRRIEALADCEGTLLGDRRANPPYGLAGGSPGGRAADSLITSDVAGSAPAQRRIKLRPGDVLEVRTPGGGGWGSAG
jgi:N-methylhydantoinase B